MSEYIRDKISEAFHEAKAITFSQAPELESFARGVEYGLSKALLLANEQRTYCASCGQFKHTPLYRPEKNGYICLTCSEKLLDEYLEEKIKNG